MTTNQDATATPAVTKEEAKRFRMSELNLQNESIANYLGDSSGHLKVEKAVDALLETRESNKLLTKVIVGLILYAFLLTAAVFGVSIAAREMAKETTMDPSTGFVTVKSAQDSPIVRTAEAIVSSKPNSIHGMSKEGLADLLSVSFQDSAVTFQVKGYGRTESKTMLLVEGGVLTFDDTGSVDFTGDLPSLVIKPFGHEGKGEGRKLQDKKFHEVGAVSRASSSPLPETPTSLPDGEKCDYYQQCESEICGAGLCGGLPDGKPCNSNSHCNSGFCYDNICSKKMPNEESCINDAQCDSGNCFQLPTGSSCQARGHLQNDGEPCLRHDQCRRPVCNPQGYCNLLADGEYCESWKQCQSEVCNSHGECGKLEIGESCESNDECPRLCGWLECDIGMCSGRGECSEVCNRNGECGPLNYGEYCDSSDYNNECRDGVCNSHDECGKLADGEICESNNECRSRVCNSHGECGLLADGESCRSNNECQIEKCNRDRECGLLLDGESCHSNNECRSWWGCNGNFWEGNECGLLADGKPCSTDSNPGKNNGCQTKCNTFTRVCGWNERCRRTLDCRPNVECIRDGGYCGKRSVGQTCEEDNDCLDPLCADNLCHGRNTPDGSSCERHEECASDHCNRCNRDHCGIGYRRCGKSAAGAVCMSDGDCISGRCRPGSSAYGKCLTEIRKL